MSEADNRRFDLRSLLPWLAVGAIVIAGVVSWLLPASSLSSKATSIFALLFVSLGALIESRQRGNRIGLLLIAFGSALAIQGIVAPLVDAIENVPATTSLGLFIVLVLDHVSWMFMILTLSAILYIFPTGRLLSRRWLWAPWLAVGAVAALVSSNVFGFEIGPVIESWAATNPLGVMGLATTDVILLFGFLSLLVLVLGGMVALTMRYRRSGYAARTQIKLVLAPVALSVLSFVGVILFYQSPWLTIMFEIVLVIAAVAMPILITIAVLKYNLFDIDVVISRSLVYGALALFITALYVVVVVGIGNIVGREEQNLALSIAVVAIVAVVFEPLRNRLQRWANRLVFGHRASPYEVLSQATTRFAGTDSPDDALVQVTQLVVDGTGATEAVLWLKVGGSLQPSAASPIVALDGLRAVPVSGDDLPKLPGQTSTPVRHRGEMLGALSITKPSGEPVTVIDEKMLNDVASGTGLLLRNIGLNADLAQRAEQLRVSRRRLVSTHDAERHRLERDLHDGAQQQVVAIKVKLGIARTLAEREGATEVETLVSSLADATQQAVDEMRAVAHGIYPPLLEAEGLGVALTAAGRTTLIPVDLEMEDFGRCERSVEESIYFCILETVTRAIDGGATGVRVALTQTPNAVRFTIQHDGDISELISVEDRVAAFGGWVEVARGTGETTISGELPRADLLAMKL